MSQTIDFKDIVYENTIEDCITAYNWLCHDLGYSEDKVYSYDDIMEQMYMQLECELSIDTIENIIIDFISLNEPIGIIQSSHFEFDGYGNLSIVTDTDIKSNLITLLEDYYTDINDTDVFDILGIDYENN